MTDKLKNFLGEQEESYVAGYAAETADWFRRGIYDAFAEKIASGLADKPTTKHLDVGFGFGLLLLALRVRLEKAVLMGIDTNEIMAYTAIEYAQEGGYPHTSCLGKRLTIDTKGQRITGVSQNFMHIPGYQVAAGKINFLLDDICDPQVLPAILGGEQLDSMSFTLPGASRANLYSKPFNLPAYIAAQKEDRTRMLYARNAEYSQKLRSSGVEYAACHLKPGGQLFLAERCIIEGSLDDIGDELALKPLGRMAGFFDPVDTVGMQLPKPEHAEGWGIARTAQDIHPDVQTVHIVGNTYERNNRPIQIRK